MTSRVPRPERRARLRRPARGPPRWAAGSRTTPWSVPPLPTSNCGLTSATIGAAGGPARRVEAIGAEDEPERDERDVDHGEVDRLAEGLGGQRAGRSSGRGRRPAGRGATRSASWPRPTSTAWTRAAPRWSRTSVKPPVEAPASRQTRPGRVDLERVEGGRELVAAAARRTDRGSTTAIARPASTRSPALRSSAPASPSPRDADPAER